MSQIDDLKAFLAANPTTKVWVEEVLIRGGPADTPGWGVVKGAHFTIGLILQTPLGSSAPQIVGPFSAAEVPDGDTTPFSQIVGITVIQQQRTIDQQAAQIADLTTQGQAKDSTIASLTSDGQAKDAAIATLTTAGQAKDQRITDLTAAADAKDNQIADLTAQLVTSQPQ